MSIFDENEHREAFWETVRQAIEAREQADRARRSGRMTGLAIGLSVAALAVALMAWRRRASDDIA
ncbi:hypothetical protein R82526_01743 [Ralstonia mannitolilytica]|jgi:hypothetical protein|uniref:hypothetical protein n=1 Tax=Ralstonia mannitolilytica TaxID=105219 RepID=UPI0007B01754|nr:hypothetical protein [Ralstonia mannitolilytica]ATG19819.1 hypothetical protein CO705_08075 [Ralstonia pickettii]ANA32078.1 hypothetical protein VZ52_00980 [Ralstonia mannitolilytica]CAJ0682432.1 hypothetical protein R82526_01743 [Ralstonia mannitolilytica]CAJ0716813.1 hypothetical protein LMG8323_03369 [Ralstonia mannitolilytica]CAJ0740658.1 hypothetical protein R76696_03074 [Ralstonia mannitolilytica]